jgi:hypothetical protein
MHQIPQLHRRVLHGALVMLERSAGKLARSVLRGLGGREPTWLPGDNRKKGALCILSRSKFTLMTSG